MSVDRSPVMRHGLLTDSEAREAVMNGAKVRLRRYPPYLSCPLCRGDGSNLRPFVMGCGPHPEGWEIVPDANA